MLNKAEIRIEKFKNGISSKWTDCETGEELSNGVALSGNEARCIGDEIWTDVTEVLEYHHAKALRIKIEYEVIG